MNEILRDLINEGHVVVYLDDILIFTKDLNEHRRLVHRVLSKLREHHLYLKGSKCFFEEREISYLRLIVGSGIIKTDPKKIEAVKEWAIPKTKKELQAFIGFLIHQRLLKDCMTATPAHRKQTLCLGEGTTGSLCTAKRGALL